jgi:hypothetical protein
MARTATAMFRISTVFENLMLNCQTWRGRCYLAGLMIGGISIT